MGLFRKTRYSFARVIFKIHLIDGTDGFAERAVRFKESDEDDLREEIVLAASNIIDHYVLLGDAIYPSSAINKVTWRINPVAPEGA